MRRRRLLGLLYFVLILLAGCGEEPKDTIRVLFIGNSYTFYNEMPKMVAELARASGHPLVVDMVAEGGWNLADHLASAKTLDRIAGEKWHVVILQEQSTIPTLPLERTRTMYPALRQLHRQIHETGAQTMLFMTWGYRDGLAEAGYRDFNAMQRQLYDAYLGIGDELGVAVAPVGMAWQNALADDRQLALWRDDGSHPSELGSYLAACVFYTMIYRESPQGVPYTAGLPEASALSLQKVAAETVLPDRERWNIH